MKNEEYLTAKYEIQKIQQNNPLYSESQILLKAVDSLYKKWVDKRRGTSTALSLTETISSIQTEIDNIENIDLNQFRGSIENLQDELLFFNQLSQIINTNIRNENKEINKLTS